MADYNVANFNTLSITDLYENEELFCYIMDEIGISARKERDKIVGDGFNSIRTIVRHHSNDIDAFRKYLTGLNKTYASASVAAIRVYYPPLIIARLMGVIHYFHQGVTVFHCIPDPSFIDDNKADELAQIYKSFTSKKDTDDVDVDIPKLTGSSNWIDFRDKFLLKLSIEIGSRKFPIDYVVDDTVRNVTRANANLREVDEIDLSEDEIYKVQATQFGKQYKKDNSQVWLMLKTLLIGTPVYNHINSFNGSNNGRGAWLALKQFYEGQDFQARLKEQAFNKILHTFYRGDTHRFNFEKYIAVHKEAHKHLEDSGYNEGSGLDESTKCHHFISGIKESAGLEHALTAARSNPQYRDYISLTSYLTSEVDHRNLRKQQLKKGNDRTISGVEKTKSKDNSKFKSKFIGGKKVFAKQYSKVEWSKLSPPQKDAVIQMRQEIRRNKADKKSKDDNTSKTIQGITIDDMVSIGDAIVAGVKMAQSESLSDTEDTRTTSSTIASTSSSKRKAPAGGVGKFLADRKRTNHNKI